MKKLIYILIFVTGLLSCNNQSKTQNEKAVIDNETKIAEIKNSPMTISEFFDNYYESDILEDNKFERADSLFNNPFNNEQIDTISIYSYKNSEIKTYNSVITDILIRDSKLVENYFFKLGISTQSFKDWFIDFDEKNTNEFIDGPIVKIKDENITLAASIEQNLTWTFGFREDTLSFIYYYAYYE